MVYNGNELPAPGPLFGQSEQNKGHSILLSPGQVPTTVLKMKSGVVSGQLMSVTLGLRPDNAEPEPESLYVLPSIRARIEWGMGGISVKAKCDFLHGTVLNISAENIQIVAEYIINKLPGEENQDLKCYPAYWVSAGLSYGGAGVNSNPARLTELVQQTEVGVPARIVIPNYAISFSVLPISGNVSLKVFGFGSNYSVDYNVTAPLTNSGQHNTENAFPLFNGAQFIELTGPNPVNLAFIVFGLVL